MDKFPSWWGITPPKLAVERLRYLKLEGEPKNFGILRIPKSLQLRSKYRRCFKSNKELLISPPREPWSWQRSHRRLSLRTCPVVLWQWTPSQLQHSSLAQKESLFEGSWMPLLKLKRAYLSSSLQRAFGLCPTQQPNFVTIVKRK